jgi:hypothetical protein
MSVRPYKPKSDPAPTRHVPNQRLFVILVYVETKHDRERVDPARATAGRNDRLNRTTPSATASSIVAAKLTHTKRRRRGGS